MKHRIIRAAVAVGLALMLGVWSTSYTAAWHQRGRDAWVAHQLDEYDKFVPGPLSEARHLVSSTLVWFLVLAAYEGAIAVLEKLLSSGD